SHLHTTAPPSSCERKRAGTASRPLSSTECRYSPVNTCLATPVGFDWCAAEVMLPSDWFRGYGTSPHFSPLHATWTRILHPARRSSMLKTHEGPHPIRAAPASRAPWLPRRPGLAA